MPRYRIQNNPTFDGLLSKEDLFLLIERGSISRGEICQDTRTGRSHKVGELISGMAAPTPDDPAARVERPAYQEIRADAPGDEPEAEDDDDAEDEIDDSEFTASGERICYRDHPSWLSYWKPLLLVALLGIAGGLALQFGQQFLFIGLLAASASLVVIAVLRFSRDFVVTDERVEMIWGIFGRSSKEVRICDIRSIDVHETGLLGFLGIGSVDFSSAANSDVEVAFRHIRGAHRVKELVRQLQSSAAEAKQS